MIPARMDLEEIWPQCSNRRSQLRPKRDFGLVYPTGRSPPLVLQILQPDKRKEMNCEKLGPQSDSILKKVQHNPDNFPQTKRIRLHVRRRTRAAGAET